jgi:hypothetical protein
MYFIADCSWKEFCTAVCARFEKEQHNLLIRQFFHLKQLGNVADYVEQFDGILHQLLAHDPNMQPALITSRFIDGLRDDIKVVVIVHRLVDLDAACSLALLQEEILGSFPRKITRALIISFNLGICTRIPLHIILLPSRVVIQVLLKLDFHHILKKEDILMLPRQLVLKHLMKNLLP